MTVSLPKSRIGNMSFHEPYILIRDFCMAKWYLSGCCSVRSSSRLNVRLNDSAVLREICIAAGTTARLCLDTNLGSIRKQLLFNGSEKLRTKLSPRHYDIIGYN